jgi:hypothetical protein
MNTILSRENLAAEPGWHYRAGQLLVRAAMLGLILILSLRTAQYLGFAARAITFPFELNYGEGIVWQQALLIPGSRMYGDITQFPFIVFHYTPVYHLVVRTVAALGIDPLAAGRGVTLAAAIAMTVLVGGIVSTAMREITSTSACVVGAAVAGLMVLAYHPVQEWAVAMRVDLLATAFSFAGVYLAILARQSTIALCAAILMFVLALYTKQTELSAPLAAMLVAAVVDGRTMVRAFAFALLVGGTAFVILQLSTDGGFWHHVFEYNFHNRYFLQRVIDNVLLQKPEALGVLVGVLAFAFLWWTEGTAVLARNINGWVAALRESRRLRALAIVSLWFIFASAQLVTLGKWGSASNYFIEWMCITTVPTGMVASLAWDRAATRNRAVRFAGLAGLLLSLALAKHVLHRPLFELPIVDAPNELARRSHLVNLIRENPKPSLSEDMVLLLRAGQTVPIEPAIFTDLTFTGIWDQRPFLHLIEDHAFGLIILQDQDWGRFTKEAAMAVRKNYPLAEHFDNYIIRRTSDP